MPYHVGGLRQVLLDVPMTLCATTGRCTASPASAETGRRGAGWWPARADRRDRPDQGDRGPAGRRADRVLRVLYPGGPAAGPARPALALAAAGAVVARPPALARPVGPAGTGQNYLAVAAVPAVEPLRAVLPARWCRRRSGSLVLALAVAGLWLLRRHNSWREGLLLCWASVPVAFFKIWPVKGYQYLLVGRAGAAVCWPPAPSLRVRMPRRPACGRPSPAGRAGVVAAAVVLSLRRAEPGSRSNPCRPRRSWRAPAACPPAGRRPLDRREPARRARG